VALGACSKIEYVPHDAIAGWSPTVVLMHRGGGNDCADINSASSTVTPPCWANTLPAVRHGFETLDGAEVDIQITADGTLWLGHDNEVHDCANAGIGCAQDKHDSDLDAVAYCDWNTNTPCTPDANNAATCIQHYVRLADVFASISGWLPEKRISLDIKGQYCGSFGIQDAQEMGDKVDQLVRQYGMGGRVLAETEQLAFIEEVTAKGTPIDLFINALGDVDGPLTAAHRQGADGISFKYGPDSEPMNASVVAGIHGSGFRIILWTIDSAADIAAAWEAAPDAIETDEPFFFSCIPGAAGPCPAP
jgi:glycerophosphoryl diester phosphodiesterase